MELIKHIESQGLFDKTNKLLLAVSGGADSMAMLHLLVRAGYQCEVAHVNFQLRGEASDADAALVERVAHDAGLEFHTMSIDTLHYASEHKLSMEMAARQIRYDFFDKILTQRSLDFVVVAHHKNDIIETFFINLLRGTGLRGLAGIESKNGRIVRPLLGDSHDDLVAYLESNGLAYRTDESNYDTTIQRNKLRQVILPSLEEEKPGFSDIMYRTIGRLQESEKIVKAFVEEWKSKHVKVQDGELFIPKQALYNSVSPSAILFDILQPLGFSNAVIDDLASDTQKRVGAHFEAPTFRLTVDREGFVVDQCQISNLSYTIDEGMTELQVPLQMYFSTHINDDFVVEKSKMMAFLDADKLVFPLTLRRWQQGDVFCPIGMNGKKKKVSDFFIDNKFSIPEKEKTWLLCSGDDIVWVVGHRLDDRYKLTNQTHRIFKIKIEC